MVRTVVRPMTKALNPLMGKFAGRRHFRMAAELHHVGRRSGKEYVTTVGARLDESRFIIPLTFGNRSDWAVTSEPPGTAGSGWVVRITKSASPSFWTRPTPARWSGRLSTRP